MTLSPEGATPAMAQWFDCKAENPDALLFFRMGDFYELFFSDAEAAVAALDIQLTYRGQHGGRPIPMCGVPVHAAEMYLARLIRRGFRVAVVEQMEKPKQGNKAPIKREMVRLVTPGTLVEDTLLEPGRCNLLMALVERAGKIGAAWMDISSGSFETECVALTELSALLGRLDPAEILTRPGMALGDHAGRLTPLDNVPTAAAARQNLATIFRNAGPEAFGCFSDLELQAASLAIDYARMTQAGRLPRLSHPCPRGTSDILIMDAATRASLDIVRAARDGTTKHTLLSAVDRTLTAAGGRMLAEWLQAPLCSVDAIGIRQNRWAWLIEQPALLSMLQTNLRGAPDMDRALGRLALGKCVPRDLAAIRDGLALAYDFSAMLAEAPVFADLVKALPVAPTLRETLARALHREPPTEKGADHPVIAAGFDGELDAHRSLRDDSRRVIAKLQLDYAQAFGVASLKIKHHQQMGYVIEVSSLFVETLRARPELQLRQGMANGARFTHPELSDLDQRIRSAGDLAAAREQSVLAHLVETILAEGEAIAAAANALAFLDVAQSAAKLAIGGRWCSPVLSDDNSFIVRDGRHPVVEEAIAGKATFMANGCDLSPDHRVMLLTGPNMAGKSTFLRQNALLVILAQAGLPVPAASAHIGIVDRLFSRVGASDDLARGQSTFMVEMIETASILRGAGPRSLVVVDEIGRGTATLDGLALAWAVLEALHFQNRCRTIFATHFHELAELGAEMACLSPHTMKVLDNKSGVVFLHEVATGKAGRSWGVHVAQLAGVPPPVVRRAGQILSALERNGPLTQDAALPLFAAANRIDHPEALPPERGEVSEWPSPDRPANRSNDELYGALAMIDPDQLSPKDALNALYQLKKIAAHDPVLVS